MPSLALVERVRAWAITGFLDSSPDGRSSGSQRLNFLLQNQHLRGSQRFWSALRSALRAVYPETCAVCDAELRLRARADESEGLIVPLCVSCCPWEIGEEFLASGCPYCDSPQLTKNLSCPLCRSFPLPFCELRSVYWYAGRAEEVMKAYKYRGRWRLGSTLAEMAWCRLIERGAADCLFDVDCIVPVPTTTENFLRRGFHHTALLAEGLGRLCHLPVERHGLRARKTAAAQASLKSWQRRRENIAAAFSADSKRMRGKKVLLLDDVITTGATLNEAAETLYRAGAELVNGLSICRAPAFLKYRMAAAQCWEAEDREDLEEEVRIR